MGQETAGTTCRKAGKPSGKPTGWDICSFIGGDLDDSVSLSTGDAPAAEVGTSVRQREGDVEGKVPLTLREPDQRELLSS